MLALHRCSKAFTRSVQASPKSLLAPFSTRPSSSIAQRLFGLESNIASKDFTNRWLMVVPAFTTHMCLGAPYAWSLVADQITREIGFVAPVMTDWSLMQAALPLSIVFIVQGITAGICGKWQARVGPRAALGCASICFGGGFMLGALGIHLHSLPLLYAGYGLLGGTGIGLAYTPPVQALMQWFPDKKGIASGLTIAGFGSGALLFAPVAQKLMRYFAKVPEYLGPIGKYPTTIADGKMFATVNDQVVEVVTAGAAEVAKLPYALSEGLYVVGTGSTGAAEALGIIGLGYFGLMMASALLFKSPHPSYMSHTKTGAVAVTEGADVSVDAAMKTPQFYLLGTTFFCVAAGGMGLFSVAKTMMSEVFSTALPAIVTASFASSYVMLLSAGNLGGRLGWAAVSDSIGRRNVFLIFTAGSIPLYLSIPYFVDTAMSTGASLPLYGFCFSTAVAVSIFGGLYAVTPAYEADLFGAKNVGAIHGRMLLFSSSAALAGPYILLKLRAMSEKAAIDGLLEKIAPAKFEAFFGAPIEKAGELFAAKTLSISKLLALAPPGTIDPTPFMYNTTMYTLAGFMAVATLAHALVRPIQQVATSTVTPVAEPVSETPATASEKKF